MQAHTTLIVFINELRKSIRALGVGVLAVTLIIFVLSPRLLEVVQGHLAHKLYFFSIAGPFLAHVKLALFTALYGLMPWITIVLWRAMGRPFGVKGMPLAFFIFFTCLLFYAGTVFCYMITLPMGIDFLLGYGSEQLKPVISVTKLSCLRSQTNTQAPPVVVQMSRRVRLIDPERMQRLTRGLFSQSSGGEYRPGQFVAECFV